MRKIIYEIIEVDREDNTLSHIYDVLMMAVILISLIPLAFKNSNTLFSAIEAVSTVIFIIDYLLRLVTADYKLSVKSPAAFLLYPFTPMALIDLLVILSAVSILKNGFRVLKVLRLLRTFRVFRAVKFLRYSRSLEIIANVLKRERRSLTAVATFAVGYILLSALIIFNVEPDSFNTFFDAVYWATVSLTTVGYGDIYPTSVLGRLTAMVSSVFGIAIIALPSGIITGGYLTEISREDQDKD